MFAFLGLWLFILLSFFCDVFSWDFFFRAAAARIRMKCKCRFRTEHFCVNIKPPQELRLTHLCLASNKRDIGKQSRLKSDATERGVWSGFILIALNTGISIKHGENKNYPDTLFIGIEPVQRVMVNKSTHYKFVTSNGRH